ncbi:hypothetical protein AB0J43_55475 [Nonomuraea fuscirosea]
MSLAGQQCRDVPGGWGHAPALRERLIDLVELLGLREHDRNPGHDTHEALVAAIRDGDGAAAEEILGTELRQTLAHLHAH